MILIYIVALNFAKLSAYEIKISNIHVDPDTSHFKDVLKRERFFHGVNLVKKDFPYYFSDTEGYKIEEDIKKMKNLGFNIVRLGVMWIGVSPQFGKVSLFYLNKIFNIIKTFEKYGIYVLIDAHQDLFSQSFCGDGSPKIDFGSKTKISFPFPLNISLNYDPETGFPLALDCTKLDFFYYYLCVDVQKSFEYLYENTPPYYFKNHFITYFYALADMFRSLDIVIGYDLFNEPFPGLLYKNQELIIPSVANKRLFRFYEDVALRIREVDDSHILFIEPVVINSDTSGFENAVGGSDYRNRTGISYHFYRPTNPNPEKTISFWDSETKKIKIGRILTEFWMAGIGEGSEEFFNTVEIADKYLHSWIAWQYIPQKFNEYSDLPSCLLKNYKQNMPGCKFNITLTIEDNSRTYPIAVSGQTIKFSFDHETYFFQIKYSISRNCRSNDTVIFHNVKLHYPLGVNVFVSKPDFCFIKTTIEDEYIIIEHDVEKCFHGSILEVHISPKKK